MISEQEANAIDKWITAFQNELCNNSTITDEVLREFACALCDDIPLGYEASHRLANWIFVYLMNNLEKNSSINNNKSTNGMIVIGYQGIGKTTYAESHHMAIDLESSNFKNDRTHYEDWHIIYCRMAVSLAKQGYIVFVSSHDEVVKELTRYDIKNNNDCKIVIISPYYRLEKEWVERLKQRWNSTKKKKDYIAYKDAEENFHTEIYLLAHQYDFMYIPIKTMDYDFNKIIEGLSIM